MLVLRDAHWALTQLPIYAECHNIPVFSYLKNRNLLLLSIEHNAIINLLVLVKQLIYAFCMRIMASCSLWSLQRRMRWWDLRFVDTNHPTLDY